MTASTTALQTWAARPLGKAARLAIGVSGMLTATLVLMTAAVVDSGSWAQVLLGVTLAVVSVRAAWIPSGTRLAALALAVLAIPLSLALF